MPCLKLSLESDAPIGMHVTSIYSCIVLLVRGQGRGLGLGGACVVAALTANSANT